MIVAGTFVYDSDKIVCFSALCFNDFRLPWKSKGVRAALVFSKFFSQNRIFPLHGSHIYPSLFQIGYRQYEMKKGREI